MEPRPRSFYVLTAFFALFILFLYGPTITIGILSFQGEGGGLTFPMRGVSLYWFHDLFEQQAVGDIWGSFRRSIALGRWSWSSRLLCPSWEDWRSGKNSRGPTFCFT